MQQTTNSPLILTVNQRLSAHMHHQYDVAQKQQAWSSLDILPFNQWLERCWQEAINKGLLAARALLSEQQELALWEKLVKQSTQGQLLLQPSQTARLAAQAWRLIHEWQLTEESLPQQSLTQPQSIDSAAFNSWKQVFNTYCQQQNLISHAELLHTIMPLLANKQLTIKSQIIFAGFDEFSPQLQDCQRTLKKAGYHVSIQQANVKNKTLNKLAFSNAELELHSMARWALQLFIQHKKALRIACVIPNLKHLRSRVEYYFRNTFQPQYYLNQTSPDQLLPYSISGGEPLSQYHSIKTTIVLLKLKYQTLNISELSFLLRSPYWLHNKQQSAIHIFDNHLRDSNFTQFTLTDLIKQAQCYEHNIHISDLIDHLEKLAQLPIKPTSYSAYDWAEQFKNLWHTVGWPGSHQLSHTETQLLNKWYDCLAEFTKFDCVTTTLTASLAIHYLQQLADRQLFQAKSGFPPIQILEKLEAAGLEFDYLWIAGVHDRDWPPPASPNPFIPLTIQRKYNIPHCSAERELAFSQLITERLYKSAQHIIVSYPQQVDNQIMRESALITPLPLVSIDSIQLADSVDLSTMIHNTQQLESVTEEQAPKVKPNEILKNSGSMIFTEMAACPFQAFAHQRLHAYGLAHTTYGLSYSQRGMLVHYALEYIWQTLHSQKTLLAATEDELNKLVSIASQTALKKLSRYLAQPLGKRYSEIERQRLNQLLIYWLAIEKQRPDFSIATLEKKSTVTLGPLSVNLKVDRIDQLKDGSFIIIDYKTGLSSIKDWFEQRPNQPQLPLYVVSSSYDIQGVLYAQVQSRTMQYKGITAVEQGINQVQSIEKVNWIADHNWNNLKKTWRDILTQLADSFYQGHAAVDPKEHSATCDKCDLSGICRVSL